MLHTTNENSNSNACKITFIIGNGFDLNLGMKTSYADIYETYVITPSKSDVIAAFKQELSNRRRYDKWADFEMGMAEYARSFRDENEFIQCIRDFKVHMVKHLQNEVEIIAKKIFSPNFEPGIAFELECSLQHFHEGLTPNVSVELANLWDNRNKDFCFLTFNYTDTLFCILVAAEEWLNSISESKRFRFDPEILHIHGSLLNDVVLGIDHESQLHALPYPLSVCGKRAFIKPFFNDQYDAQRILQARQMIEESSIICIFGFSMGATDQMWVDQLAEWLRRDIHHHLLYFEYDPNTYARCNSDELMDVEEAKKARLLERLGFLSTDEIAAQVHIPIGKKLFAFILTRGIKEFEEEVMARSSLD